MVSLWDAIFFKLLRDGLASFSNDFSNSGPVPSLPGALRVPSAPAADPEGGRGWGGGFRDEETRGGGSAHASALLEGHSWIALRIFRPVVMVAGIVLRVRWFGKPAGGRWR